MPIALIVALLAALAGPLLPGAEAEAFVDFKGGGSDGPRSRTVVSPLVSLRTRLHAEPPIDMFSVTVNEDEMVPGNLDSIESITRFVTRKAS